MEIEGSESNRSIGYLKFGAPPIVYAIVEYYRRRFGIDRRKALRAIIVEYARLDPDFKVDDLVRYAKEELRPQLKEHDWALESLDNDLQKIIDGRPSVHSLVFHRAVSPPAPIDPTKKQKTNIGPRVEIDPNAPSPARAVIAKLKELKRKQAKEQEKQQKKKKTAGRK